MIRVQIKKSVVPMPQIEELKSQYTVNEENSDRVILTVSEQDVQRLKDVYKALVEMSE